MTDRYWLPSFAHTEDAPDGGRLDQAHHERAAKWLAEQGRVFKPGIVLGPTLDTISCHSVYNKFTQASATSRGRRRGPVLALFPNIKTFRQAETLAQGTALCVFGGSSPSFDYWVDLHDATPLSDFAPVRLEPLQAESADALDSALLFGGNNSFASSHEKQRARVAIQRLKQARVRPTVEQVEAYLVAHSRVKAKGIEWFCNEYGA